MSFDVVSYGAGLTKMSLGRFAGGLRRHAPAHLRLRVGGRLLVGQGPLSIAAGVAVVAGLLLLPAAIERFNFLDCGARSATRPA
jgi:hypothetical protein